MLLSLSPAYVFRPSQIVRRIGRPKHGTASVPLPWGASIAVCVDEHVGSGIARTGVHELVTTEALWRLTAPGEIALDVGANVGYFTSLLAWRGANVTAFEPHPEIRAALASNAAAWPDITVDPRAVSDQSGTATLSLANDFERNHGNAMIVTAGEGLAVETVRLDDIVTEPVGVMKIDVEGHEFAALHGAERLLSEGLVRDILFEDHDAVHSRVFGYLRSHGYRLFGMRQMFRGVALVDPLSRGARPRWDAPNYLATLKPDRARRLMRGWGWRSLRATT